MSNTPPLATAGWKSLDLPAFGGGGHPTDIDKTLADRGKRYGNFMGHSNITQRIKAAMHGTGNWGRLEDDQREALDMIAHKIGRILNGDPNYHDSWHDIVGYTKLVADRLLQTMPVAAAPAPKTETGKLMSSGRVPEWVPLNDMI